MYLARVTLALFTMAFLIMLSHKVFAGDFYKWVDDSGNTHFTDSLSDVPAKYLRQVEEHEYEKRPSKSTVKSLSGSTNLLRRQAGPGQSNGKLKHYEIKYRAYEGAARRIIVPVTFNGSVTAPMALDTGAPGLSISRKLADKLGLFDNDEGKLETFAGGIGGSVPAVRTIIDTVNIGGAQDKFISANIFPSISSSFEGLIGMDFMSRFSIKIDTRRHLLILEELPPKPNMYAGHDEAWWRINYYHFGQMRSSWKKIRDDLKTSSAAGKGSGNPEFKKYAEKQYQEADKLYRKLDRYANYNSVPTHWRRR